jgi:valyl-tRNA synthetase
MTPRYEPGRIEERWYSFWEREGYFSQDPEKDKSFSIVIPPPNITGSLHMGHALNNTIQDILCRWHRMQGYSVLWLPGTDHAGIATQNVVEKALAREGKKREELGRSEFLARVWRWKEEYGGRIIEQLKRLGCSCDWSRLRFTMDEGLSRAVREVFVRLYKEGLIYQGDYIINWCPRCKTALSDIEVEYRREEGKLWYLKYPLKREDRYVVVATTRPETMLGDTAVAVNPEDVRYKDIVGKTAILPLMNREIPVIADSFVDIDFGTGAVKITPAHDLQDFEASLRHNLPKIKIMREDGKIQNTEKYDGLDRFVCREKVLEDLEREGLVEKIEDYEYSIGHCYRCDTVVEPYLSKQWFVKTRSLAKEAIEAVRKKKCRFFPSFWERTYFAWMENIKDWCISRQIWWGHRIPVWYCECGEKIVEAETPKACKCGKTELFQDPDVLDTWFSSALWPFSTMGWPDETDDLKRFYPTSVLSTGFDIIFFWVARMLMMGVKFTGDVPFRSVYIHGLIKDAEGAKMSKSSGNVIDPIDVIERYGCDALRFTLSVMCAQGRDIPLSYERIEGYRHFMNKLWNAGRFILMNLDGYCERGPEPKTIAQRWILAELSKVVEETTEHLKTFSFNLAASLLYEFFWHKYCDWFLEIAKIELSEDRENTQAILVKSFGTILRLLHPFIPFITEELWQKLPGADGSIMVQSWPEPFAEEDREASEKMKLAMDIVTGIRNVRSLFCVLPKKRVEVLIRSDSEEIKECAGYIMRLANISQLSIDPDLKRPPQSAVVVVSQTEIYIKLAGIIDIDVEKKRLEKKLSEIEKELERVEKRLENRGFLLRAPEDIVKKERRKREEFYTEKKKIEDVLTGISLRP